jgi:hypothetical protein
MYCTMSRFLVPGPPPLSAWIIANSFIWPSVSRRITRTEVGAIDGSVMLRNRCHAFAPSRAAAS